MTERWLPIAGFEGRYEVSDHGRVRGMARRVPHNHAPFLEVPSRVIAPRARPDGYLLYGLRAGGKVRTFIRAHRLVANAFLPNPEGKPQVNHIDHNPGNNRADNLEWCTPAENMAHMTRAGRRRNGWAGKRGTKAFLTDEQVRQIRADREAGLTVKLIAERHGIATDSAQRVCSRKAYAYVA